MARILNQEEYTQRRNEILAAAQRLIYICGYEQMSIQDLLDELHISKGAFYHYFKSKPALLYALVERMQEEADHILAPIFQDDQLSAPEKLQHTISAISQWKSGQKAFLLSLLRVWYADDNALVRFKRAEAMLASFAPQLDRIIRQGIEEGSFQPAHPDQAGVVALALMNSLGDAVASLILADPPDPNTMQRVASLTAAYTSALEHVMGAPPGSFELIDPATLEEWFSVSPK